MFLAQFSKELNSCKFLTTIFSTSHWCRVRRPAVTLSSVYLRHYVLL